MFVMKLSASPARTCTRDGVTMIRCGSLSDRVVVPAPHEALGQQYWPRPLRRVRVSVVINLLHHPRLIFLGQQRQESRDLIPKSSAYQFCPRGHA